MVPVGETAGYSAIAGRSAVAPSSLGGASGASGNSGSAGGGSGGTAGGNGDHKSIVVAGTSSVGGISSVLGSSAIAGKTSTAGTSSGGNSLGSNAGGGVALGGSSPSGAGTSSGGSPAGGSSATAAGGVSSGGSSASGGSSPASGGAALGGNGAGGSSAGDTIAPRVLGVTPADGSTGLDANTKLEVTFSEAMDTASVASAMALTDLTLSNLTLTWNSDHTVLSIKANDGFAYASGNNTTFAPKTFNLQLSTVAKDLAGNGLASAYSSNFKTLRRVSQTIAARAVYQGNTYALGTPNCYGMGSIGGFTTSWSGHYGEQILFVTFNTDDMLPPTAVEQAVLRAVQGAPSGDLYGTGSWVELFKLEYQVLDDTVYSASQTAVGKFTVAATDSSPVLSVLGELRADFAAGRRNQLFKLSAYPADYSSKYAAFDCTSFAIDTTYLTP